MPIERSSFSSNCIIIFIIIIFIFFIIYRGTTADLITKPGVGLLIGILGGVVSIVGYKFITPGLLKTHKFHDTCGVTNLHGLPGLLASIISWIAIPTLDDELFDD